MAKQAVSPLERHIDKGILAVAVVVLIAAIAEFLVRSPSRVEVAGELVGPSQIDQRVADQARLVRNRIRNAKPPQVEVDPMLPDFEEAMDTLAYAQVDARLPRAVPFLPQTPIIGQVKGMGTVDLVEALPLPKPVAVTGRCLMGLPQADLQWYSDLKSEDQFFFPPAPEDCLPVNWVTISAVWDRSAQEKLQQQKYGKGRDEPLLGGIEVQRRARRPDGTWSDADFKTIALYQRAHLPEVAPINFVPNSDGVLGADEASLDKTRQLFELLKTPAVELNLMRPLPLLPLPPEDNPPNASAFMWKYPTIEGSDPVVEDSEYHTPWVTSKFKPVRRLMQDRYPRQKEEDADAETGVTGRTPFGQDLTPEERKNWRKTIQKAKEDYVAAMKEDDKNAWTLAYNKVARLFKDPPGAEAKGEALEYLHEFDQMERDYKRKRHTMAIKERLNPSTSESNTPTENVIPHPKYPIQQVWGIDSRYGTVVGGQWYQYRIRPRLFNPYVNQPQYMKNPEDAKKIFITGEWSEPSDPVYIEPPTQLYARYSNKKKVEVAVDIFKWFNGFWVKGNFKLGVGDIVGTEQHQPIEGEKPSVDFSTQQMVLDIDFDRPWRQRKKVGRSGFRFANPEPATSMTIMDDKGNLSERIVEVDKANPHAKMMAGKVYRPKLSAGAGSDNPADQGITPTRATRQGREGASGVITFGASPARGQRGGQQGKGSSKRP